MDDAPIEAPQVRTGPCQHLRHKGMYVFTDGSRDGDDFDHDDDSSVYWCLKTMKGYGPDDDVVDRAGCCRAGRACYAPL